MASPTEYVGPGLFLVKLDMIPSPGEEISSPDRVLGHVKKETCWGNPSLFISSPSLVMLF